MAKEYSLGKNEKLRHKTLVDGVFAGGKTIYEYPLRLTYRIVGKEELTQAFRASVPKGVGKIQMLITVPKKKLRHAVDRVRMRRLIRETYRLNRNQLKTTIAENDSIGTLSLAFIYLHSQKVSYAQIEKKMCRLLAALGKELNDERDG